MLRDGIFSLRVMRETMSATRTSIGRVLLHHGCLDCGVVESMHGLERVLTPGPAAAVPSRAMVSFTEASFLQGGGMDGHEFPGMSSPTG